MIDEDMLEWSREIINSLMKKKNDSRYLYEMVITLRPNPLDYDGGDEVIIEILEEDQRYKGATISLFCETNVCFSLEEAMKEINKLVAKSEV